MNIGEPVRTLIVEPIVSPVPDTDLPGRPAELAPPPPAPMSGSTAASAAGDREA
jgi:hypothetical protein